MRAFFLGEWDAVLVDYAEAAVIATPNGIWEGCDEMAGFMVKIATHQPPFQFESKVVGVIRSVCCAEWAMKRGTPDAVTGVGVLVVRDGEIRFPTGADIRST